MSKPTGISPDDKALWRYGIIAPLLHHDDSDPSLFKMITKLSEKSFIRPDGQPLQLSPETIRKWLYRYRKGGLESLKDQKRRDKGLSRTNRNVVMAMADLRKKYPHLTLAGILEKMLAKGNWNGRHPSRATLYRIAAQKKLLRYPQAGPPSARAFAFTAFGQLWIADFMHGPKLRCGRRFKKTYLHAIIDDASRYIVSARFYLNETVEVLLTEMMIATKRYGICQRFYTDNGPCYASNHLKQVTARLGIHLVHTPPYRPQGRGKVERFFRTVRDQFLGELHANTLERLNADLKAYLAEYHKRIHRGIGASPLQKRFAGDNVCRLLPEVTDLTKLFFLKRRCRVYNDATIRIAGLRFEVPGCAPGYIDVHYMPWDKSKVFYDDDLKPARLLDPAANANRFTHPEGGKS